MTVMVPEIHAAAHLLTLRVIQSLVEGSVIGGVAAMLLRILRQSASARFAVWFSSLMMIAALPLISSEGLWRVPEHSSASAAVILPDSWALYVLLAWALVASWSLIGVIRSLVHLSALRKNCVEIETTTLDPMIQETFRRNCGGRKVQLCTSSQVRIPTAVGLMMPAVVIPDWLMQELSADELNQILLHELAHLRRRDDWTNLVQQVVKAIFFFHPVVWWIERKVAQEREMACDDAVVAETKSPQTYATCLANLAEKTFVHRSLALAQAALGRVRETTQRITRILDPNRAMPHNRMLKPALFLITMLGVGCGIWSARISNLVAFDDGRPGSSETAASNSVPARAMQVPAVFHPSPEGLAVTPTNLRLQKPVSKASVKEHGQRTVTRSRRSDQLIHLAKAMRSTPAVSETMFVVIEQPVPGMTDRSGYQIQFWHVTVFRTVANPAQISRKQI